MKKIFSMLLISALMISALAVFSACRDDSEDEPEKASKIDVSSYTLVRGDDVGDELVKYSLLLRDLINKHTGADVNLKGDFAEPSEKEILIGETERAESKTVYAILEKAPKNAYVIKAIGNKIVIAGKTEDATIRAMKRFLENNVKSAEGTVLNMDTAYEEKGTVDLSSVLFDNFAEMIPEVTLDMAVPNNISTGYSYETMIQLAHNGDKNGMLIASHASLYGYDDGYKMYRSYDNGDTWEMYATALDTITENLSDCYMQPCLFELPANMGNFKEGTLFLGGCTRSEKGEKSNIILYYSTDLGESWTSYVNLAIGGRADDRLGVWEPYIIYEEETGRVYCFYSDETYPKNGEKAQKLVYKYTTDMVNWSELKTAVSCEKKDCRPGMVSIAKLGNGEYYMTFEMIGNEKRSPAYAKKTRNLDDWGDPADCGKLIITSDGKSIGSAPWCAWTPKGGDCGMILVVARWMSSGTPIYDEGYNGTGSDMLVSFDYGETFVAIKNPIQYNQIDNEDKAKCGYSPFIGFSEDGGTLYYFNSVPFKNDNTKVRFKRMRVW
ncbi:MAG: exo-alpha-sialidase [Ruminococcaceae bacterium]|nr:exo-alpha-sialidase [Oscillospiraceae bacterium]